jgi:hypothetical protein
VAAHGEPPTDAPAAEESEEAEESE